MNPINTSKRRFLKISGTAAGMACLGPAAALPASSRTHYWNGIALGAEATLQFHHPDAALARRLIGQTVAELKRLEQLFSLYRADSAISRLNRDGHLPGPSGDFIALLSQSLRFSELTDGAFDITVQPLWNLYARHAGSHEPTAPGPRELEDTLARVGYRHLEVERSHVRFLRPDMAITLNGIAQGYITDRITDFLSNAGIENALVNMGEIRTLNAPGARPWRIGLEDPANPGSMYKSLLSHNSAVATSGGYGTPLDSQGRWNHLFDPCTGSCSHRYRNISVQAPNAATADALSTAFHAMPEGDIRRVSEAARIGTHLVQASGQQQCIRPFEIA